MMYRVFYLEDPAVAFKGTLIREWKRGEIEEPVMSASSGPKDYTANHIWAIFDRYPTISSVLMMRGQYTRSPAFLLVTDAEGQVWDMAGKPVVMKEQR